LRFSDDSQEYKPLEYALSNKKAMASAKFLIGLDARVDLNMCLKLMTSNHFDSSIFAKIIEQRGIFSSEELNFVSAIQK